MELNTARSRPSEKVGQTEYWTIKTLHLHGYVHVIVHIFYLSDQLDLFQRINQNGEFTIDDVFRVFNCGGFGFTTA